MRHFIVLTLMVSAGVAEAKFTSSSCYYWGQWSSYSAQTACDATCGMGEQQRERSRTCHHPGYYPPPGCRFKQVEKEKTTCDSGVACDGTLGTWTQWSTDGQCSQYCGNGKRQSTRTRTCTDTGRCSEPLSETRTEACLGLGGYCRFPCYGYRSFIYRLGSPLSDVCLRGRYERINCPANRNDLLRTCGRDYIKCQVYWRIEYYCARFPATTPAEDG